MASEQNMRQMLTGGDRRSPGRADEVAELVRLNPKQVNELVDCLCDTDACVRMRAADALEKLSRENARLLQVYKSRFLSLMGEATQQELRWHLALMVPRLKLTHDECGQAAEVMHSYLEDRSSIVKTCAMQGLSDLIKQDERLEPMVLELIRVHTRTGTAAMRARGRKLLRELEQQ